MVRPTRTDLTLFAEAVVQLTAASVAIRTLPFPRLVRLLGEARTTDGNLSSDSRSLRQAVERASRRLPWRTKCFEEGLAIYWMLRRRGAAPQLHYGIRPEPSRLSAHVWVTLDGKMVIGEEEQGRGHAQVAIFPAPR